MKKALKPMLAVINSSELASRSMKDFHAVLLYVLAVLLPFSLAAQGISIVDCNGRSRASTISKSANVEIDVVAPSAAPSNPPIITLTNAEGEILKATVRDGTATFLDVAPGTWVVGSESTGVFFSEIGFSGFIPPTFLESIGDAALVVGAVTGGAVIAGIIHEATDGNSGRGDGTGTGCPDCNPDAEAPSVPAF